MVSWFFVLGGGWLYFQALRYEIQGKSLTDERFRRAHAWHHPPPSPNYIYKKESHQVTLSILSYTNSICNPSVSSTASANSF